MVLVNTTKQGGKSLLCYVWSLLHAGQVTDPYESDCFSVHDFLHFGLAFFLVLHPAQRVVALGLLSRSPFDGAKCYACRKLGQDWHLYETCCSAGDSGLIQLYYFNSVQMIPLLALCALAHSLQRYVLVLRACMYVCIGSRVWGRKKRG